ncbi:hypothetical protein ACIP93_32675 [Streptomyces sp. NPDC088745]|uniref:hypothetical protein n=1 Tax=Streptomyces sp. NPDC088745 TaxID=3365884 RepID=UPI0037FC7850
MTYRDGDKVLIKGCDGDPDAVGRVGMIVGDAPIDGRWTVIGVGSYLGPAACRTDQLKALIPPHKTDGGAR